LPQNYLFSGVFHPAVSGQAGKEMLKTLIYILILHIPLLAGCLKIPEKHQTLGHYGESGGVHTDSLCRGLNGSGKGSMPTGGREMLDPQQFSLINWNSYKGKGPEWRDDLDRLIRAGDIVTLQEGYLTDLLQDELQQHDLYWDIAEAFFSGKFPAGS